ncbi:MAG TPA: hypothetical protein VFG41_09240 [Sphingomicrobium sp.]|nr:hypothetical protein [Sphingomicrobium sp.]
MANRWCDGFGRYGGDEAKMLNGSSGQAWAQVDTNGFALSNANPRTGLWHLRLTPISTIGKTARRVFGAPLTEVFVGKAIYCHDLPASEDSGAFLNGILLFGFRDQANGEQVRVVLGTDGALQVYRGSTSLGRSIPIIGAGAYQHIECYAKAGNATDGALELRVDEVTRLNLTGIDTVSTANVEFSQIAFGHQSNGDSDKLPMIDYADIYCNDTTDDGSGCNSFLGDVKSGWFSVDADTAQADFTLSSGATGYSLLSEVPPNDTTYIDTASSTARSDFGVTDGPANMSEILTARPAVRAWKDDAGTCTIAPNMKSGSTDGTVSDQPVTTAPAYYDSNVPLDPATGVPWTPSGFNAALEIVERAS